MAVRVSLNLLQSTAAAIVSAIRSEESARLGMSFVITVKMDASTVDAAIPKMKQQLESAEQAGEKLSKTLTKSGREGATSMDAIGRSRAERVRPARPAQRRGEGVRTAHVRARAPAPHPRADPRPDARAHGRCPVAEHADEERRDHGRAVRGPDRAVAQESDGIRSPMDAVSLPSPAQRHRRAAAHSRACRERSPPARRSTARRRSSISRTRTRACRTGYARSPAARRTSTS